MTRDALLRTGLAVAAIAVSSDVFAQEFDIRTYLPEGEASATGRMLQLIIVITVLSVAPGILMTVTSFTRFVIALSFLRAGLGLQTTPGNLVLVSLALFLTLFVMAPTFETAWMRGIKPMIDNKISIEQGYAETTAPFRTFMSANAREKDLNFFKEIYEERHPGTNVPRDDLRILIPAFMTSELRRGFEIGFLIVLPFIVIDLVVATILMAMGMMMMPPTVVSMPLKVLFFVLIDGWTLLVGSLAKSFIG